MTKITFRTLLFCLVALCGGNALAATLEFSGSPTSITAGGETTLTWKYTGPASTTYCSASGAWGGKKALSGQQTFLNITTTSKYNLSCTDARSSVTITVVPVVPAPTVSLSANPTSISSGASSTLTWSSTNATSCAASGAWSGDKTASVSSVSEVLSNILATSSYTLTCTGTGGSASQTATVTVTSTIPPTVSSISPATSATNVAVNSVITANFSEAMDPATISAATFTLNGDSAVAGTVTYTGTTATFAPSVNLTPSTTYTATITTGAKDLEGNALAANYTWTFTTSRPRIAIAGASNVNRSSYSETPNQGFAAHNWLQWFFAMVGPRFDVVSMAGEGGRQVTEVDAKFTTEVGDFKPDVVILGSDSVGNWLYNAQGATPQGGVDYVNSIYTQSAALGARFIVFNLPPNANLTVENDSTFIKTNNTHEYNTLLAAWVSEHPGVVLLDFSKTVDPDAAFGRYTTTAENTSTSTAWTHDGTHPHPRLAIYWANVLKDALANDVLLTPWTVSQHFITDNSSGLINPLTLGNNGEKNRGASGEVADNWTLGGPAVGSKFPRSDLGDNSAWQQVKLDNATANVTLQIAGTSTLPPSFTAGETPLMALIEVRVNGPQPVNLRGLQAQINFTGSRTNIYGFNVSTTGAFTELSDSGPYLPLDQTLWLGTAVETIPVDATGIGNVTLTLGKSVGGNITADLLVGRVLLVPKSERPNVVFPQRVP